VIPEQGQSVDSPVARRVHFRDRSRSDDLDDLRACIEESSQRISTLEDNQLSSEAQRDLVLLRKDIGDLCTTMDETRLAVRNHLGEDVPSLVPFGDDLEAVCVARDEHGANYESLEKFEQMREDLDALRATIHDSKERFATLEYSNEDIKAMKLVWTTAHTALTQDMRELMERFRENLPRTSHLTSQIGMLRKDLVVEAEDRNRAVETLVNRVRHLEALLDVQKQCATRGPRAPARIRRDRFAALRGSL